MTKRPARPARSRRARARARPCPGPAAKLIARISAATSTTESIPPRLSTGSVVSLTWLGTTLTASGNATSDERQRDQEDRAPVELLEQRARDQRAERGDRAAERRPERDRLRAARPRPERRDQGQRRRDRPCRPRARRGYGRRTARVVGANAASREAGTDSAIPSRSRACARSGRRAHRSRAPTRRDRASSRRRSDRASSATSRTACRCPAARRSRPTGSGSRRRRRGSAWRAPAGRAREPRRPRGRSVSRRPWVPRSPPAGRGASPDGDEPSSVRPSIIGKPKPGMRAVEKSSVIDEILTVGLRAPAPASSTSGASVPATTGCVSATERPVPSTRA